MSKDDFAVDFDYHYLLDNPDFRRFIQNVRRRTENSAYELDVCTVDQAIRRTMSAVP